MSEIQWKQITMEDKPLFQSYYEKEQSRSCEFTFANNLLWSPHYKTKYAIVEEMLVFLSPEGKISVSFPLGSGDKKKAMEALFFYFEKEGEPFRMHMVTPEQFQSLEMLYPGKFQIEYDRDAADYIYESEKLITLSGKKLHSKRNHLNRFKEEHSDWQYEAITSDNRQECLEMAKKWRELNGCEEDEEKEAEFCVTLNALKSMESLGLRGGLIRLGGEVIAFSLGEPLCKDTFVVHIEKAYAHIQGAYPIINQQFAEHEAAAYQYVNREEDVGSEGLRKAKLSYRPVFLQEKGLVTFK
ncbi:MAG: DUF2156 domain-containing protein [Lachnospiraceae bacterium]|nr:DUF2156 domain-containing protein [Lachnospiraceae bacterium]